MSGIMTRLELIADWVDVSEFYDDDGELNANRATDEIFLMVGALVTKVVVDDLNSIPILVDDAEMMILLTQRYLWTALDRIAYADSWRRWPTDRLAAFIVDIMAKVLPPFWWNIGAGEALTVAAGIIDGYRDETGLIESDTREFVESIGFAVVGPVSEPGVAADPESRGRILPADAVVPDRSDLATIGTDRVPDRRWGTGFAIRAVDTRGMGTEQNKAPGSCSLCDDPSVLIRRRRDMRRA